MNSLGIIENVSGNNVRITEETWNCKNWIGEEGAKISIRSPDGVLKASPIISACLINERTIHFKDKLRNIKEHDVIYYRKESIATQLYNVAKWIQDEDNIEDSWELIHGSLKRICRRIEQSFLKSPSK